MFGRGLLCLAGGREWSQPRYAFAALSTVVLAACNAPEPPATTPGTTNEHGLVVVSSDYQSTNVSLVSYAGDVLSSSLIHSGSASSGLSAPLSGDVVVPTMPAVLGELVLIDRFASSVLTWVNVRSGEVSAQLPVGSGFKADPHDFLPIAMNKAYVPRREPNLRSGIEPFDAGDDLLVIAPGSKAISGRVDLASALTDERAEFHARPERGVVVSERAYVVLNGMNLDNTESASARVVVIDTAQDAIVSVHVIDGFHNCLGVALSPERTELALACSGPLGSASPEPIQSGLALFELAPVLVEKARFRAAQFGSGPVGFGVAYASERSLVFTTAGSFEEGSRPARPDNLLELDIASATHRVLLQSAREPFSLGDVRCAGDPRACFVTDAGREGGLLQRYDVTPEGGLTGQRSIRVDERIGLPPRYLGEF